MKTILAWVLKFLLDYIWAKIKPELEKISDKVKRKEDQKAPLEKLEEVNKEGASVEEKVKAEKEFLNS